jgi:hypothetical protein
MSLESVVHKLVDVAAGLDRIGAHEAPALHEAIRAGEAVAEDVARDAPVVEHVVTDVAAGL